MANDRRPLFERLTRGEFQGYLSFLLMIVLIVIPFLHLPTETLETAVGFTVLVLVLVFGIRGMRFMRGGGGVAARLSLAILTFTILTSVVIVTRGLFIELLETMANDPR